MSLLLVAYISGDLVISYANKTRRLGYRKEVWIDGVMKIILKLISAVAVRLLISWCDSTCISSRLAPTVGLEISERYASARHILQLLCIARQKPSCLRLQSKLSPPSLI
jgi:hypothetical protein